MSVVRISVIVCTHNRAALLPNLIDQLRNQKYPADAFEIIVVDNGSTDQTKQVVEKCTNAPGVPVHYISENRTGVTFARNRGAEISRYPTLAYLDDDCCVGQDWLAQMVRGFELREDVAVVGGRVVLDWSQQARPAWLGPELEPWLAENSSLGDQPRLLGNKIQVMEGNMALTRQAWSDAGGFLGMEQFGSRNMSAGEVLYLLHQIRQRGGQVAFIPQAVAAHRMGKFTRRRFIQRAYWQGISDGILEYLIYKRSWFSTLGHALVNGGAAITLFSLAAFFSILADQAKGMLYLVKAIRRSSLLLSELHLIGDWPGIQTWAAAHCPA